MRYQCNNCHRYFTNAAEELPIARVLLFDIETLPGKKRFWRLGEEDWNIQTIIENWIVLSYSAKWLFEPTVMSSILTTKEALARDDQRVVQEIWNLFNSADVVVAHNGDRFDIVRMSTRFIFYEMDIPSPYLTVDTRATAKRHFDFPSNSLDGLARYFGYDGKIHTDYDLWVRCEAGEQEALDYMLEYNTQDILTLEDIYVRLRPWIKHPNMSLYLSIDTDTQACPKCSCQDVFQDGTYRTSASVFDAYRCNNCGAVWRNKTRRSTTAVRSVN